MLHPLEGLNDEQFENEVCNILFKDGHPNIIGLLGYCDEIHSEFVEYHGKKVSSKHVYRGLCFEYFPSGSLHKHLVGKSLAANWSTRYSIIKGICEGLNFLHGREKPIFHLDLKPDNILLDNSMVPKLADFGLSKLFAQSHTHVTERMIGTDKYMPPEYRMGSISSKNDVYSFGVVMIEIMEGYSLFQEMDNVAQIKEEVFSKWSSMIEPTSKYRKNKLIQVRTCIDTAMLCVDHERQNRPTVAAILATLNGTETHIPSKQLAALPPCPTIDLKNSLAKTVKTLTAEMDNITNSVPNREQVPNLRVASPTMEEPLIIQRTGNRETSSNVVERVIIGRVKEKTEILSILSENSTNEMVILPIHGIGGIGKTTLAQLVYNDTQFSGYSRVWVYVSEKFNLKKIGNSIISLLTNQISDLDSMELLNNQLGILLAGKSILIVLDDLWEKDPDELDKLKAMLRLGQGSKVILVTTRNEAIARIICSTDKNVPYKLEILTDDMCWTIIKKKSDFENKADKNILEQIGRDIAIKCGGVALAAQSLGYLLMSMRTSDQWESVKNSDVWNPSNSKDASLQTHKVLASLWLSYSHMDIWTQSCFSYCGVFQKGDNIAKYDLIHQWMALELTEPSKIFDSMQLCEQYITHLLGLSFLQYSSDECEDGYTTYFTMHDLVHDLATTTLANKFNKNGNDVGRNCQYALVRDPSKPLQSFVSSPENLKALHFLDCAKIELIDGAISPAKCLHVLDLRGCNDIRKLPDSIGQLKQLRYLHAPRIRDWMIPNCITELSKLNYLSLRRSDIKALPDSIGDTKGLMHLDLSYCQELIELPVSFAELKQLVHLDLSHCAVSVPESLGGFTKLQYLNLEWHTKVLPEVIGKLTKLRYFNLSRCKMSETDIHSLLVVVSNLYNLEHLDLSGNDNLTSIPECIGNLSKLHTLNLSDCFEIDELPSCMNKMVSLKIVHMCTYVLEIRKLECSTNLVLLEAIYPDLLEISKLENVMSLEEAQSIKLILKHSVVDLTLKWTVGWGTRCVDDKDVLEKLVPPDTIETLNLSGYRSLSFPTNWLMGIGQYLPNVSEITLEDLPKCNKLPPLGRLPNLSILSLHRLGSLEELNTADSCGELMFRNLEELDIISCPKLRLKPCLPRAVWKLYIYASDNILISLDKSVSQTSASSSSSLSMMLEVERCTVPLHQWTLLQHASAIHKLVISDCIDLTSCPPGVIQCLSSLGSLELKDDILTELPTWLLELTSLKELTIRAPKLEKLNDITRQLMTGLESLESLDLEDDILTELPTWLLELTSLKKLTIRAPKLEKLNDNVRQLMTGLESLDLSGCGSMVSLPQWLGELTSLRALYITQCEGIRSLPGSIRQLTKLQTLWIDSYHMYSSDIEKMFTSISADTDEIDIQKLIAADPFFVRRVGVRHTWTRRPRQLVPAASTATPNCPNTSSGTRINNNIDTAPDPLITPADVIATAAATNFEDLVRSLSALSLEPGS